jgi:tetratricopeptide (TPR) repeat protein
LGSTKYFLKDYKGAIEQQTKAIGIDPNNSTAYSNRGINKIMIGDFEDGCKDLNRAIELGADYEILKKYLKEYCK